MRLKTYHDYIQSESWATRTELYAKLDQAFIEKGYTKAGRFCQKYFPILERCYSKFRDTKRTGRQSATTSINPQDTTEDGGTSLTERPATDVSTSADSSGGSTGKGTGML